MASCKIMNEMGRRFTALSLPLNIFFELTYACNEVCRHCYLVNKPFVRLGDKISGKDPPHNELTTEEVKRVLDQIAEVKGFFLTFTGGEVFLRDDIIELAAYAKRKRFALRFFTNALMIDDQIIGALAELKPLEIGVSVYSPYPDLHDRITRIPGSFQITTSNIKKMTEAGLNLSMKCPLMAHTARDLPRFIKLAQKLGARPKFDISITPADDGGKAPLSLRIEGRENLQDLLQNENLFPSQGKESSGCKKNVPIMCDAGKALVNISPFGDVFPCIQFRMFAGNVRKQSFVDIWKSSAMLVQLRSLENKNFPICNGCEYRNYCGKCPGVSHLEDGDALGPSSRACALAKARHSLFCSAESDFFL